MQSRPLKTTEKICYVCMKCLNKSDKDMFLWKLPYVQQTFIQTFYFIYFFDWDYYI